MRSLFGAIVTGIVGALILHIVIILAIPHFATRTAWAKVSSLGETGTFQILRKGAGAKSLGSADPYVRTAVCAFSDDGSPIRVSAGSPPPFWSLAVFDTHSNEIYSMNDRSAVERTVDVTLATSPQMITLRRSLPDALAKSILVELPETDGYVVLRTISEDPTWDAMAHGFLAAARCAPVAAP